MVYFFLRGPVLSIPRENYLRRNLKMIKAVVGANWGDEGKGKITDMLAEKADIIVRFQGGSQRGTYHRQ